MPSHREIINMKPSTVLRALSFWIPARLSASPATVAPSPIRSQFDQRATSELDALQSHDFGVSHSEFSSATWFIDALIAASTTTQKIALESLADVIAQDSDRKLIDEYLDANIDMLDACNEVSEKIEIVQKYIQSLSRVSHLLEGNFEPNPAIRARARHMLASCNSIERSSEMNRKSKLRKLLSRRFSHGRSTDATTQLGEILTGSKAVALFVCGILGMTLSFKSSKRMFPSIRLQSTNSWSFSLLGLHKKMAENRGSFGSTTLTEFRRAVKASRKLRDRIMKFQTESDQIGICVEELRISCGELEERIKGLEGKVKELYKSLIDVRMALLNRLSKA